jgi:hypothetical protein
MYGWSLLPRNHPVRPYLEELESRCVLDATTGVFTTGAFATFAPAVNSSFSFVQLFGPFATAAGTSPFNVNTTAALFGPGSPATSLQTVGGLPVTTLSPGTLNSGSPTGGTVPASAVQVAANEQAGVPGTAAPSVLFPLNPLQIEQGAALPATPEVMIVAWAPVLARLNPVETRMAANVFPLASFVSQSMPLPLLSSMARFNSGAGNGGITGPATGLAGGSGQYLPARPGASEDLLEDELLDALRGISRLDDLSGPDRPAADGQQADTGDSLFTQAPLFPEGDRMADRLPDRISVG